MKKDNSELARLIIEDGQPARAMINYMIDTFDLLGGIECVDNINSEMIDMNNMRYEEMPNCLKNEPIELSKEEFIECLEWVIQVFKKDEEETN